MEMEQSLGACVRGSTGLHAEKTVGYHYEEPVREVVTRLRMFPLARHGAQHLLRQEVEVWPEPTHRRSYRDAFGNEVREFAHARIEKQLQFAVRVWTEHRPSRGRTRGACGGLYPSLADSGASPFLTLTSLVDGSEEIEQRAREFTTEFADPRARVEAIFRWLYRTMRFQSGVTAIDTPASAALAGRVGVCQDYTHVMLALCRASGIPARYASGFIPGEGYMHAWVEVLLGDAGGRNARWIGFDPTHNRPTDHHYLTVATGRDYTDISPISGSFYGSAPGRLQTWTRTITQSPIPGLRIAPSPTGAAPVVTDRMPDGNIAVIQHGYSC